MGSSNKAVHIKRSRRRSRSKIIWLIVFIFILLFSLLIYFNKHRIPSVKEAFETPKNEKIEEQITSEPFQLDTGSSNQIVRDEPADNKEITQPVDAINQPPDTLQPIQEEELMPQEVTINDVPKDSVCASSAKIVKDFFHHLDQQEYMQPYLNGQKSESYFIPIIQNLVNNPPVVSGETNDLFTILQNTAHFFRIIGKNNIQALKAILHNEKDRYEEVLFNFYTLSNHEGCTKSEFGLDLPENALYDYAGFFLNTVGGRLYLFRRESMSRMTAIYYSILIVQAANREGRNSHGIDIHPPVRLLIPEIEENGSQLLMRDRYLEKLYEINLQ